MQGKGLGVGGSFFSTWQLRALPQPLPDCSPPIPLCNAGEASSLLPPFPAGSQALAHSQSQPQCCAGHRCQELLGEGCKQNTSFASAGQPAARPCVVGVQGMGERQGTRSGCKGVPSSGRGTLPEHRHAWDNGCACCPGPGITQYSLFLIHAPA